MKTIVALFDAPIPARRVVARLAALGIGGADVDIVPASVASAALEDGTARYPEMLPSDDEARLARELVGMGASHEDAHALAEGVRRGAILLVVRAPDLAAPEVVRVIDAAAPPDLSAHRARWATFPATAYRWAAIEPPVVDLP